MLADAHGVFREGFLVLPMNPGELELPDAVEAVLAACEKIPAGMVASYGDIGQQCGLGPRQVGRIMGEYGYLVCWWRVVRADGSSAVAERARSYWDDEGIAYDGAKVVMRAHRFRGW